MAVSDVDICNRALQKLGASRIASLTEDSSNATECAVAYPILRDAELAKHRWSFAMARVVLAPMVDAPAFDYGYAFQMPADCLAVVKPAREGLDWQIEGRTILTNEGDTLELRYVKRVTDTSQYDAAFVEALASKIAYELCERITQSNSKKQAAAEDYKAALADARKRNAFEKIPDAQPPDSWLVARF